MLHAVTAVMAHHVAATMTVTHHAMTIAVTHHAMAAMVPVAHHAMAVHAVHPDLSYGGRGIDGADHARSGGGRGGDADSTERGQGSDGEQGLPHGGFLFGCWWLVTAPCRSRIEWPYGSGEERLRFEEGSEDVQSPSRRG